MAKYLAGTVKPINASCGWSSSANFWKAPGTAVCKFIPALVGLNYPNEVNARLSIGGGWLSGTVGRGCASTDAYIDQEYFGLGGAFLIKIWESLEAGLWTSSVTFNIYANRWSGSNPTTLTVRPYVSPAIIPAAQTKALTLVSGGVECASTSVASLVFYDDGTFILS